jgi:Uma2 family endonuclease
VSRTDVRTWTYADYERAAQEYLEGLPLEHFMESGKQSRQREITLASLALVRARRPGFQIGSEMLVQYVVNGGDLGQVVPDNMVVLGPEALTDLGSFNVSFEQGTIFWVLEYVSESNKRKDYVDNFRRYGAELKVPYYLLFHPDAQNLQLHRHNGTDYDPVRPDVDGRLAIPELEIGAALAGGWVRFWYRGELLALPDELAAQLDELRDELDAARTREVDEKRRADREEQRAEAERQKAEAGQRRAEQAEAEVQRLRAMLAQMQAGETGASGV